MGRLTYPTIRHAARQPDHPAVIDGGLTLTYGELELRVQSAARNLLSLGVRPLDRVAVAGVNSLAWVVLAHAIPRIGAILAPINPQLNPQEAVLYMERIAPALVLVDDIAGGSPAHAGWPGCPVVPLLEVTAERSVVGTAELREEITPDDLHTIIPTSGTTGTPKGVCLTMQNHLAGALASALNLGIDPQDRWLANLPFHHVGGIAIIMRAAFYGTTIVIQNQFAAEAVIEAIPRDRITQLSLVGTMLARLLDAIGNRPFPHSVRSVLVGGGPVSRSLVSEARARGLPVLPTYGLTETASQVATLSPGAAMEKLHTTGRPLAMCEVEIRDEAGQPLAAGCDGTICVRGPMVSSGYWTAPDHIEPIGHDGWFVTSDVGTLDTEGFLVVRGRRDGVIITGGEKVFPEEVEAILEQVDGVARAAVFAVHDRAWGQRVVALVEVAPDAAFDPDALRAHLERRLAHYKIPKTIMRVDRLPLTATGKIDRRQLTSADGPVCGRID